MRRKRKYFDDRGFTFIELLVSIIILGIMVIPLMNSFLTSSRINATARKKLKATEIARNVLELTKRSTLSDVCLGFNIEAKTSEKLSDWSSILKQNHYFEVVKDSTGKFEKATLPGTGGNSHTATLKKIGSEYEFDLNGKKELFYFAEDVDVNQGKMNVLIKYDLSNETPKNKFSKKLHKFKTLKQEDVMIQSTDRVEDVMKKINSDNTIKQDFFGTSDTSGLSISIGQVGRTCKIVLEKASGSDSVTLTADYIYRIGTKEYATVTEKFFDKVEKAEDIYFLFFPWYGGKFDTIIIENKGLSYGRIKLIKQVDTRLAENQLKSSESSYHPSIEFIRIGEGEFGLQVMTNINTNLADSTPLNFVSYFFNSFPINENSNNKVKILKEILEEDKDTIYKDTEIFVYDNEVGIDMLHTVKPILKLNGGSLY